MTISSVLFGLLAALSCIALVLSSPIAETQAPLCPYILRNLPNNCACEDEKDAFGFPGAIATCTVQLPENLDTVTVVAEILPCDAQASINLKISERKFGASFATTITEGSGYQQTAIPGASFTYPGLPINVQLYVDSLISGNADSIQIDLGLDLCADVPFVGNECGQLITSELPLWLLNNTYSFTGLC